MAEIKSTLDMVMARAARLTAEAPDQLPDTTGREDGMRFAVRYLNGEETDLVEMLNRQKPQEQMNVRGGMAAVLLRNIILPREDTVAAETMLSLKGLNELSGNAADIGTICSELRQIIEQYAQHRQQIKQQFDESILNQLKMSLQHQGLSVDDTRTLNPTMHPKYNEEWNRISGDLNDQYNEALEQRKQLIAQRFNR